jgi:Fe-Mn family superoxide dismutase
MILAGILAENGTFNLPSLPFGKTDLAPLMSEETFNFHYEKHHKTYIDNLNNLIKGTAFEGKTLGEIITLSAGKPEFAGVFNNSAQVFNHTFFWHSMKKNGGGEPTGKLLEKIKQDFGGFTEFKTAFKTAGLGQFGSGWAWLVLNKNTGKLEVVKTANAETPLTTAHLKPLLTVDVWEHAYYIDYRNKRVDYLDVFIEKLINWNFVLENYENA